MTGRKIRILNWSSGKDAAFALWVLKEQGKPVNGLLTTLSRENHRVSMHGLRENLLERQAASIGLPLHKINLPYPCPMEEYNMLMQAALEVYTSHHSRIAVFGDIFLQDLREYREQQLGKAGFRAEFPLWGSDTATLARSIIDVGFKAIVLCVDASKIDKSFCGRTFDHHFLADLPENVDPCGENGEFHTFVSDGPIFSKPVKVRTGQTVTYGWPGTNDNAQPAKEFHYIDLLPY